MEVIFKIVVCFHLFVTVIFGKEIHFLQFKQCADLNGKLFLAEPFIELQADSISECVELCGRISACAFVVFSWNKKACRYHEKRDFTSPVKTTLENTTVYYDASLESESCPTEWYYNPTLHTCFYISSDKMTWSDSKARCWQMGGYLSEVQSFDEWDYLKTTLTTVLGFNFWIGVSGNQRYQNSARFNSQPYDLLYTNWAPNFPISMTWCAALDKSVGLMWTERDCNKPRYFTCSMPAGLCL